MRMIDRPGFFNESIHLPRKKNPLLFMLFCSTSTAAAADDDVDDDVEEEGIWLSDRTAEVIGGVVLLLLTSGISGNFMLAPSSNITIRLAMGGGEKQSLAVSNEVGCITPFLDDTDIVMVLLSNLNKFALKPPSIPQAPLTDFA